MRPLLLFFALMISGWVQAHDPLAELQSRMDELDFSLGRVSAQADQTTFLQEQINANRTAIDTIKTSGLSAKGVIRQTAVPPRRFHNLSPGTLVPSDGLIKQTNFLDIEFTIEHFKKIDATTWERMAIISRDETGQTLPGHFSLYIDTDRRLHLRSQGGENEPTLSLKAQPQFEANETHRVHVIIGPKRTHLFLDGVEVGQSPIVNSLSGNDLPLIIGATCWAAKETVCINEPEKRRHRFRGTISADLYQNTVTFILH